jgi:hypothetical protein
VFVLWLPVRAWACAACLLHAEACMDCVWVCKPYGLRVGVQTGLHLSTCKQEYVTDP